MKPTTLAMATNIVIATDLSLNEVGVIEVTTVTTSHGNAIYRTMGRLEAADRGWAIFERGTDGAENMVLFDASKKAALDKYARRATAKAAQWAAA